MWRHGGPYKRLANANYVDGDIDAPMNLALDDRKESATRKKPGNRVPGGQWPNIEAVNVEWRDYL